ncbi:MAG TPA: ABC transporter ATP-binding protein [Symbiobacteriaceae bacterium]|nr:ABC transporter ATP-binding protein [Symbiobacteriaceae bacterium]
MLDIKSLSVSYGPVLALRDVSLTVSAGEIVTLVGANGAGKTTLLKCLSGMLAPASGTISFAGESIGGLSPDQVVRRGMAHVPEGRRVFPGLTVLENLAVAAYALGYKDKQIAEDTARILETFPNLKRRAKSYAWSLSGGEQQMLAIGRGLMAHPRLLMLDEPSLGLAPLLVEEVLQVVADINRMGTTILLVEQNASLALELAHRGYVLENGKVALEGTGAGLLKDPRVMEAYLGGMDAGG